MTKILAVAGPTASGKTALSVELALRLGGEVVSFDSMQVYRDLSIGTAKPDEDERRGVPHHLFDLLDAGEEFSCADFCAAARPVIADISSRGKLPILVGGTGLYLDSLLAGDGLSTAGADEKIREKYEAYARENGSTALHSLLRSVDPASADAIHENNVKRVIRALEIYDLTGVTKSEWDERSKNVPKEYDCTTVIIEYEDRETLYSRIERRVDAMFDAGLEKEARMLWDKGLLTGGSGVSQAIGYKEFVPYFTGEGTLDDVREQIVLSTRHYAKRQITWFARNKNAVRVYADGKDVSSLADEVMEIIR